MKRRVLVAQALVHKPPVIMLDEPTAGVDVELRQTLWNFIGRLNREGHTVVLTTHYLEEAQALCSRIAMLKAGRVVALDSTAALIGRISGSQLVVKLSGGKLPSSLHALVSHPDELLAGDKYTLRVNHHDEVEGILATIRDSGATLEDLQLHQADLEDVFMQVMGGDK
jgi:ABC-2 type transport system ATP-binding protein